MCKSSGEKALVDRSSYLATVALTANAWTFRMNVVLWLYSPQQQEQRTGSSSGRLRRLRDL